MANEEQKLVVQVDVGKEFHPARGIGNHLPEGTIRRTIRCKILDPDGSVRVVMYMSIYFKPNGGGVEFDFAGENNVTEQLVITNKPSKVAPKVTFSKDELNLMLNMIVWIGKNHEKVYPKEYQ